MNKKLLSHNILSNKRYKKKLKRKKKKKKHTGILSKFTKYQSYKIRHETKLIENYKFNLFEFLIEKKFVLGTENESESITIPEIFSFEKNYNETIEIISDIVFSIWKRAGLSIQIDFSKCIYVDQSALFLLQILRLEMQEKLERLNAQLTVLTTKIKITILKSKNKNVNLHLLLCGLLGSADFEDIEDGVVPIDSIGFLKGSKQQKSYLENKKGIYATRIVNYVNQCLRRNGAALNHDDKSDILNLTGEILNNAEDHSPFTTYYVTANYNTRDNEEAGIVGELNLCFMNFGYSIYEGLVENKGENSDMFNTLLNLAKKIGENSKKTSESFTEENLFTLFSLNEGVSRLKYLEPSRGTGTMKFINCFFGIGDYIDEMSDLCPKLSIISGKTQLIFDNRYKPFKRDHSYFVSLNDEEDVTLPPNKSHLKNLKYFFPGTLLSIKIYLNKEHMLKKINVNP